jgi:hypothetical protein
VGQQDFISNAEPRTFSELKGASIYEPVYFPSVTSCVPLLHLPVLSSVTAYLNSVLVSTLLRTGTITHLEHLEVRNAAPYRLWAREGIGTRAMS